MMKSLIKTPFIFWVFLTIAGLFLVVYNLAQRDWIYSVIYGIFTLTCIGAIKLFFYLEEKYRKEQEDV